MPLPEFRQKKLLFVFNVFFDVNASGTIEKKDFDIAMEKICRMRGYSPSDVKYQETQKALISIWEGLKAKADKDHDGQISHTEWYTMWEEYAKAPESALEWQKEYMNFIFDLQDSSADGTIDEGEFTTVCTGYGISEADCKLAFAKFTSNGTVEINREEFAKLWQDYFVGDDPTLRGNFIFGKVNWDN